MPEKQLYPDVLDLGYSVLIQRNTIDITLCVFVCVYKLNSLIREQLIQSRVAVLRRNVQSLELQ